MVKNKFDFIEELLRDRKINSKHREKILQLASKEIGSGRTLEERIKKIEEIIFRENQPELSVANVGSSSEKNEKYLHPYYLYKFLFEYNQNPILRATCHDIDGNELKDIYEICKTKNYQFSEHLEKVLAAFEEHEKRYCAPGKVKALIRGYLTGKDFEGNQLERGWSSSFIKVNWTSPQLGEWINQNPDTPPNLNEEIANNDEIELFEVNPSINSPISKDPVQNFTQLVLHFKNLFHIRSGTQSLFEIIKRVNKVKKWTEKIDFEINPTDFSINLEHFSDVDKLIQAYNKIIKLIYENGKENRPKVKLRYYQEDQVVFLSIHHLNSTYNKTIANTIERFGQTYTSLIKNQINGLCNLRLKADFGDKMYAEINLWDGNEREARELPPFQGVEHVLEFPKTMPDKDLIASF